MKPLAKFVLLALTVGIIIVGLRTAAQRGWIPTPGIMRALVPDKAELPDVKDAQVANVEPAAYPSTRAAKIKATLIRGEVWAWNAQMNLLYANGGPQTTENSLMAKRHVNLQIIRQDDTNQMQNDLIACANEIHGGADQCATGANFVVIMGDGSGQFLAGLNPQLKKLGTEYQAIVIGATGYSRGEDKLMGLPDWKQNPANAKGALIAGVLRDGDWNIAMKWAADNNIKNNPDEKTWDADALNWVNSPDYLKAAEQYNSNYCEDRKVVKDGTVTGETKKVCINGVVTWTPGDVNVAHNRGGLVNIVSSKEYRSQMPAVIIGPKKFFHQNRTQVEGMLAAVFEAGDQLKAYPEALKRASDVSAKIYNEQNGEYWLKYFKGVTETDTKGLKVELGGSAVNNLADNLILFGLMPGSNNNFKSTYNIFGNIATQQYADLFKSTPIPQFSDIVDTSFITGAQSAMANTGSSGAVGDEADYSKNSGSVVSKRSWNINFDSGRATFTADGERTMRELLDQLAITGLHVTVDGYTDNVGDHDANIALSERRATAVKDWLQRKAANNFPDKRFNIAGHGDSNPVATNATAEGKARNRRVEITLSE